MKATDNFHTLGKYRLAPRILGRGGFGTVYRGLDEQSKPYAIKVFLSDTEEDHYYNVQELRTEKAAHVALKHKHLVKVHEFQESATLVMSDGTEVSCSYMVMDLYIAG